MSTTLAHAARLLAWCGAAAALLLVPQAIADPYVIHVLASMMLYVIMTMGLGIVVQQAGLLDLGYIAFAAAGAYLYAILNVRCGVPFLVALPAGAAVAALLGVLLGLPTLRVRGDYLALVTLAFGEMVHQALLNGGAITGGPRGLANIDPPSLLPGASTHPRQYFYLIASLMLVLVVAYGRLCRSPMAHVWRAIRDDEVAARSSGIRPIAWLLLAFAIGAAFAGLAGVLFASTQRFVSPESFVLDNSILVLSMVVLAGNGSLFRILLAVAVLQGAPELFRGLAQYRPLAFGLVLVAFVIIDDRLARTRRSVASLSATSGDLPESPLPMALPPSLTSPLGAIGRIKIEGVRKSFGGVHALRGFRAVLDPAVGIVGIVGPNGAGKTTLFECMCGAQSVDAGSMHVDGVGELAGRTAPQVARLGVCRTYQRVRLFPTMTVRSHVEIGAYCNERIPAIRPLIARRLIAGFRDRVRRRTDDAMRLVGIDDLAELPATSLPLGTQRRVELARALAMRPRVLLLDEVASGLSDAEKHRLAETLMSIAASGRIAIVVVEHDMSFMTQVAAELVAMDAGQVIAHGHPHDVFGDPRVVRSYLGSQEGDH